MITKYQDWKGNLAEIETYDDIGPSVARLMRCGVHEYKGTIDGLRRAPINIAPNVLYDRFEGTLEQCVEWVKGKGFE